MRLLRSKIFLTFLILTGLATIAGVVAVKQKYHVKKFVKEHPFLYEQAMHAAQFKDWVTSKLGLGKSSQPRFRLREIDYTRQNWSFAFDAGQSLGTYQRFWGDLGFESFRSGVLTSQSRELFSLIQETNSRAGDGSFGRNAFRYVRAHNLFSNGEPPWGEGLDIYQVDGQGRVTYDWSMTDMVFDRLLSYGLKPIVEFGFMPDALASLPDRRQQWGRANISPPKDYQAWQDLVFATVQHFVERYGEQEVASWYFEVWNEPDLGYLFWIEDPDPRLKPYGDMREYYRLYDHTVSAARRAFPGLQVGGPASAGGAVGGLLEHIFVEENRLSLPAGTTPIDFVSSHAYNVIGQDYRGDVKQSLLAKIHWKVNDAVSHDHEAVRNNAKKLPFLLTETGPKLKDKNEILNKGRYIAAWYAKMVDSMFFLADTLGQPFNPREVVYWAGHQVVKEFDMTESGIATTVKIDGNAEVFKLPVYNAFEALGYLSEERIPMLIGSQFGDPLRAIATRSGSESVEILFYHLNEEINEVSNGVNPDSVSVRLMLRNLPFRNFELQRFAIDETHSNSFTAWQRMGSPRRIDRRQAASLHKSEGLETCAPVTIERTDENGKYLLNFKMQAQSVLLLRLLAH